MKVHGTAIFLRYLRQYLAGESPIAALRGDDENARRILNRAFEFNAFRPSDVIREVVCRCLRGKPGATVKEWNALCEKVGERIYTNHVAIRSAALTEYTWQGEGEYIAAWSIKKDQAYTSEACSWLGQEGKLERARRLVKEATEHYERHNYSLDSRLACKLKTCDICGKVSGGMKVKNRADVYGWDADHFKYGFYQYGGKEAKTMLCTCCWNRAKAVMKRKYYFMECKNLIAQINKEIKHGQAN